MPDISVLSGYAARYASARNAGLSDSVAHSMATAVTGGSGVTVADVIRTVEGSRVSAGTFVVGPNGYVSNAPVVSGPTYPGQGLPPPSVNNVAVPVTARGPEALPGLLAGMKPSGDTLGYVFLGALGIFLLRMSGK